MSMRKESVSRLARRIELKETADKKAADQARCDKEIDEIHATMTRIRKSTINSYSPSLLDSSCSLWLLLRMLFTLIKPYGVVCYTVPSSPWGPVFC